jgi:hypothetical protein
MYDWGTICALLFVLIKKSISYKSGLNTVVHEQSQQIESV